jgi:catechol 2,3-dioxygenase-like lactoylglutathione lyase family enzyme
MIDHIAVNVSDYERSKSFYLAALGPVGYELVMEFGKAGGFGPGGKPVLWLREQQPVGSMHLAVTAPDHATVDAFHAAALAAGGEDNGAPGLRPHYHASYYAAFVHDPDGNNLEVVNHGPGIGPA